MSNFNKSEQGSDEIKVTITYKKEDMKCCICFNYLSKRIYRCTNGPHYVCGTCNESCKSCPVCKSGLLARSNEIEESLKKYLVNCANDGCPDKIFDWDNERVWQERYRHYKLNGQICLSLSLSLNHTHTLT